MRQYVDVRLGDQIIRNLESIKLRIQSRKKNADTSFSSEDKTCMVQVSDKVDGMPFPNLC